MRLKVLVLIALGCSLLTACSSVHDEVRTGDWEKEMTEITEYVDTSAKRAKEEPEKPVAMTGEQQPSLAKITDSDLITQNYSKEDVLEILENQYKLGDYTLPQLSEVDALDVTDLSGLDPAVSKLISQLIGDDGQVISVDSVEGLESLLKSFGFDADSIWKELNLNEENIIIGD